MTYDPRRGLYLGVPTPPLPPVPADELELLVRFEHPAKFLAVKELPGAALLGDEALATAYGTTVPELTRIRDRLTAEVRAAAAGLDAAGFPPGRCVALGDSITDDLQSWAEILRCSVDAEVVNAGISGDTSADALARLYAVADLRPDLVIAMLGTNDCQRHGPDEVRRVGTRDSLRNIRAITSWLETTGAHVVWLTPPPVDAAALARAVAPRPFTIRPRDVARLTAGLLASGLHVIDTGAPDLLPDGVHPSLTGQTTIARRVLAGIRAG